MREKFTDCTQPSLEQIHSYFCLLCNERDIRPNDVHAHKSSHGNAKRYGMMLPQSFMPSPIPTTVVPTYSSPVIARVLGVSEVYIRDEGVNPSGSMKDYIVDRIVRMGTERGYKSFAAVSSGNHAVSLSLRAKQEGASAIVFAPAKSAKIPLLASFPNTIVVGMQDAVFEDVYNLATQIELNGVFDANPSNEDLLPALIPVAADILELERIPTHILAGVGNGTYLAGIGFGLSVLQNTTPKIVPVGMKGAFPTEEAFRLNKPIVEYQDFLVEEHLIDAAEGSIALESYSMPQLIHALRETEGFPLGNLTNDDLRNAYLLLKEDSNLLERGAIPEPTGIMSLAAAYLWRDRFSPDDVLHLSFTGHGAKDLETIKRLLPTVGDELATCASANRPELVATSPPSSSSAVISITKETTRDALESLLHEHMLRILEVKEVAQ